MKNSLITTLLVMVFSTSYASPLIGVGKMNITPPSSLFPFQANHEQYPYVGVHDSLYSRAVVMDNDGKRAVIVELDEVQVPDADNFVEAVAHEANVAKESVIVCVSHTHSTLHPGVDDSRLDGLVTMIKQQTLAAVRLAVATLQPAAVAFGRTKAYVNINNGEIVHSKGQYNNDAFSDKTLDVVRFSKVDGTPLAYIVNYSTHAEVMFRSLSKPTGYEVTGDLPGRVAELLENQTGKPVVLTTAGAEGDQQPIFTSRQHTTTQGYVDQKSGGWIIVDVLAHRLVDAVNELVANMPAGKNEVSVSTKYSVAVIPGQHIRQDKDKGIFAVEPAADVRVPIVQIKLGNIVLCGVAADIASSIGVAIRNAIKIDHAMLITSTAGSIGYILPDEMYKYPTHGVFASRIKPGYAQKAIIEAINN